METQVQEVLKFKEKLEARLDHDVSPEKAAQIWARERAKDFRNSYLNRTR